MADPVAAARNFLNALEKIPSVIDQYKAKNEVLGLEIPQLQAIAGKVWKKEDELKQLKSELAALDRKIQLELAQPTLEGVEKEETAKQVKPIMENAPQIHDVASSRILTKDFTTDHVVSGRPDFQISDKNKSKGIKM